MSFWEFANNSPWLTFFLALIAGGVLRAPFHMVTRMTTRITRSRNIAARGWPPAHLDADGDWKPEPESDS